jgi:uncharacterized protein YceH (UPF0502 family)
MVFGRFDSGLSFYCSTGEQSLLTPTIGDRIMARRKKTTKKNVAKEISAVTSINSAVAILAQVCKEELPVSVSDRFGPQLDRVISRLMGIANKVPQSVALAEKRAQREASKADREKARVEKLQAKIAKAKKRLAALEAQVS